MRTIAVVSGKGGVGKTTLASALAVRAARESKRVAMVDLDPLGSLAAWWKRRGSTDNPCIFGNADTATDAVEALELDGWDYVFIDCPPAFVATMQDAIEQADLALIPLRPSALDLLGSEDAVAMAKEAKTAFVCVFNDVEPRWSGSSAAREYLVAAGVPVAKTVVAHRAAHFSAMAFGKTGPEVGKDGRAEEEISALWSEIKAALKKGRR